VIEAIESMPCADSIAPRPHGPQRASGAMLFEMPPAQHFGFDPHCFRSLFERECLIRSVWSRSPQADVLTLCAIKRTLGSAPGTASSGSYLRYS